MKYHIQRIESQLVKDHWVEDELILKQIISSDHACRILRERFSEIEWKEQFMILCMNRANKIIGYETISTGGMTGTVVDATIIFGILLNVQAKSFIIAHNHPSGNKNPSESDIQLTRKIRDAAKNLDINLLDHLIITQKGYTSFADEGLI